MTARKILIVEDESVVRLHLRRIVTAMGHEVCGQAASAREALAAAATVEPDLVLMDIRLRGTPDGVETAKQLRARHECSVVFATAFADDETIRRTEEAGAVGYVLKPFGEAAVKAAVATALREHDRMREARAGNRSLHAIIGSLGEAVFVVDPDLRVVFLNPRAEHLAWTGDAPAHGRPLLDLLRPEPDDEEILRDLLASAVTAGQATHLPTLAVQLPVGSELLVNGTIEPLTGVGDPGFVVTLRDQSRRWFGADRSEPSGPPRVMIYSHDTFGLGHLRRSLNISAALSEVDPDLSILVVTGSAFAHRFPLPPRVDYVKLPAVRKAAADRYPPRSLAVSDDDVLTLRANLLLRAVRDFRPDILLADHSPAGMRGEMKPALAWAREHLPSCRTVIGLRDVIDSPENVIAAWRRQGIFRLLEESYDHIAVYGEQNFYDPVREYDFPPALADRVRYLGHVVEPFSPTAGSPEPSSKVRDVPRILVTTGGGDGAVDEVAGGFLRMLREGTLGRAVTATVLPGPLAPAETVADLRRLAEGTGAVVETFVESTSPYMADADLVISTGGYNTAIQVLRHARRAIMVPRVLHRQEQLIRATLLADRGLVRRLLPAEITPERLAEEIRAALASPGAALATARSEGRITFDGARRMAEFCSSLLAGCRSTSETPHD